MRSFAVLVIVTNEFSDPISNLQSQTSRLSGSNSVLRSAKRQIALRIIRYTLHTVQCTWNIEYWACIQSSIHLANVSRKSTGLGLSEASIKNVVHFFSLRTKCNLNYYSWATFWINASLSQRYASLNKRVAFLIMYVHNTMDGILNRSTFNRRFHVQPVCMKRINKWENKTKNQIHSILIWLEWMSYYIFILIAIEDPLTFDILRWFSNTDYEHHRSPIWCRLKNQILKPGKIKAFLNWKSFPRFVLFGFVLVRLPIHELQPVPFL